MYYAKFDDQGNRITSIVEGVHFQRIKHDIYNDKPIQIVVGWDEETQTDIYDTAPPGTILVRSDSDTFAPSIPEGFIPISDEDQEKYVTNNYIHDPATGKPVEKPAYIPTIKENLAGIRAQRDQLLLDSDKYMLPDYPITDELRNAWRVYRQALRDMPQTCDPDNPVWPVKPE